MLKRRYFSKKELGATLVEYALLLVLIALVCMPGMRCLGQRTSANFAYVATQIDPTIVFFP
jgi:Flp pilus assembly pilin Flp